MAFHVLVVSFNYKSVCYKQPSCVCIYMWIIFSFFFPFFWGSLFWTCFAFYWSRLEGKVYYYFWLLFYTFSAISRQQKPYSMHNFHWCIMILCLDAGQLRGLTATVVWALHQTRRFETSAFLGILIFSSMCIKVHIQDLWLPFFFLEQPQCTLQS